jgi:hypothetical protein
MPVIPNTLPTSAQAQQAVKDWLRSNAIKGGQATAHSPARYKFTSETARRAALRRWPEGKAARRERGLGK